jgi:hypothetical protein
MIEQEAGAERGLAALSAHAQEGAPRRPLRVVVDGLEEIALKRSEADRLAD